MIRFLFILNNAELRNKFSFRYVPKNNTLCTELWKKSERMRLGGTTACKSLMKRKITTDSVACPGILFRGGGFKK
jgi:hypothetical protein